MQIEGEKDGKESRIRNSFSKKQNIMTNIVTLDFLHFREDLKLHYSRYIRVQEERNKSKGG